MNKGIEKRMDEQLDCEGINDPRIRKLRVAHAVACDEVSRLSGSITGLEKSLSRAKAIRDMLFEVLAEMEPSEPVRVTPGAVASYREAREKLDGGVIPWNEGRDEPRPVSNTLLSALKRHGYVYGQERLNGIDLYKVRYHGHRLDVYVQPLIDLTVSKGMDNPMFEGLTDSPIVVNDPISYSPDPDYWEKVKHEYNQVRKGYPDAMMMGSPKFNPESE